LTIEVGPEPPAAAAPVRPAAYRRRHFPAILVFLVAVAVVGPAIGTSRSNQFLVNLWLVYSVSALGFYLIFGLAGRFAFCQTFMMAMGGYTSAWVTHGGERPFLLGVAAAIAVTALLAGVIGLLVRRAQHFYFAIATFAVTEIGVIVFQRAEGFTGPNGQTVGIDPPALFGQRFVKDDETFWLFLGILVACLALAACIERSPMRREAIAARENGLVASLSGVAVDRIQLALLMLGSALGGLSGALIGHWQGAIGTDSFGIDLAIGLFLILLLGGIDSIWGPVIGSAVFVALPRLLSDAEQYSSIVYGLILLVVVLALPGGIAAEARRFGGILYGRVQSRRGGKAGEEASHADG
jgi:branched-chain amino acid transport system permease protein